MFIGASVVISVAIGILGVKSLVETLLYSQPIILRMAKNVYAFVADALVMLISLPLCISLEKVMKNIK
jgi:pyruvate kinase